MPDRSPPDVLYHYTTQESLLKILEGHKREHDTPAQNPELSQQQDPKTLTCDPGVDYVLWATKIQYMNDASELVVPLRMAGKILQQKESEAGPTDEAQRKMLCAIRSGIEGSESVNIAVISFSEHKDRLGQRRAYCRDSPGYAIGFASNKLVAGTAASTGSLTLAPCEYLCEAQQRGRIAGLISEYLPPTSQSPSTPLVYRLMKMALTMKDVSFEDEGEWRIVLSDIRSWDDLLRYNFWQCHFRAGKSMLIPYWHLPFDVSAIKEIWIGPTPHPKLAKEALRGFLYSRDLDGQVQVENSRTPYRNW
jgi:hypothetical protein